VKLAAQPRLNDMTIRGAITAMVTPFRDGKVDEDRLRNQIDFQIKSGIDGLVPVGTTGESPTLDVREHVRVVEATIRQAAGRVVVIAGVGANSTAEALELHRAALEVGANAGLSVNPYYNKPSQEGLYRHFMTLADKVALPIVLYNVPSRTGVTMSPQTVARLAKHSNIVAIKEATGNLDMATEIASLCEITILSGDDSLTVPLIAIGARGIISVASNLVPGRIKKMTAAALAGEFAGARAEHLALFPLIKALFVEGNPVGIKCAMQIAGMDSGELRLPLCTASEGTRKLLEPLVRTAAGGQ
jgi:4-hydroxy-tetrahydrodipicolinate synthase